ncbi:MAG: hypothetical protein COS76_03810 [Candidatus Portnoybacteria bacterium CG06_land_8_20_14_3_00_39_12]|uniref:VTT domain-containing protein n=1 Tax=Candidatus Portnoybacteria bacterium CG06_land_8_20_14_3_00_39_12 TaxID=1974809 RepID=A0A2M7AWD4_9BACT|nr:MAG: hypothetical protein COS76_03810 [Candidatus Portnoybacteria bacterium CG06_land_8_20_14_3_00_39_12]
MITIKSIIDFVLHIDVHLGQLIATYGVITYVILFVIIFIETGLVVTPFLPGDSLLFAAGAFAALGSFNVFFLLAFLVLAAFLGDTVNYWIGHFLGEKLIANPKIPIKKSHIEKTQKFFAKHGGKTIILARFVPIVRTFAPFVAGIGKMSYGRFISFNIIGGVAWISLFVLAGFFFGNIPSVKHNFSLVIFGIILISILPMLIEFVRSKFKK